MSEPRPASRHLGLDLGGTNIKWVVAELDGDRWRPLGHGQTATPAAAGPDAIVERLSTFGAEAIAAWPGVTTVGIGVPGRYINVPGDWSDRPVADPVGTALGLPVALINDARAFGLAELRLGAGVGARSMVGLTLGTGVGGVIVIDGHVLFGHDGTAGEIGHQTIDPDGPTCHCGNRGCLEAFARADVIAAGCGSLTVEAAVAAAGAGDERAMSNLVAVGRYLGIGIANMITVLTPDRVVIGGGVAAAGALLFDPIRSEVRRRVFMTAIEDVEIVAATLGTWAGATGAAIHGAETAAGSRATYLE